MNSIDNVQERTKDALLMKTGKNIGGVYFIASLYRNSEGILVVASGVTHELTCEH
jgi:hypothetical protein